MKYKLIINFKAYDESTTTQAKKLALACKKALPLAKKHNVDIIICPQTLDLQELVKTKVPCYAQHIDEFDAGAHTGFTLGHAVKASGAIGTLLNHSEHQLPDKKLGASVAKAKALGLKVCLCARNDARAKQLAKFKPDFIAVEPKELIGGDISISTAKPELIKKSKQAVGKVPLLVGAGVKTRQDVVRSLELGAVGILLASGIVKSKKPYETLVDLINGF